MDKVGFGLVGCGSIAFKHAEAISQVESAALVAVCDLDMNQTEALAARHRVRAAADFDSLLQEKDIDVVDICTPSFLHDGMALACAQAGKHVLVEKPMALSLDDADRMIEACSKAGVNLGVVLQNRFKPAAASLKNAVDAGYFGKLTHGTATVRWNRNRDYYRDKAWRSKATLGGGVLINQAIHNIDLLQWLMGPADYVFACTASRLLDLETEDVAAGVIQFKNGALGIVEAASTIYPQNLEESIGIFGETGTVIIGGVRADAVLIRRFDTEEKNRSFDAGLSPENRGHVPVIEDMVRSVRTGTKPEVDGMEGRKSLELVLAFHESARTKKPVKIA